MQSLRLLISCVPFSLGTSVATGRQCSRKEKCHILLSIDFSVCKMAYKTTMLSAKYLFLEVNQIVFLHRDVLVVMGHWT